MPPASETLKPLRQASGRSARHRHRRCPDPSLPPRRWWRAARWNSGRARLARQADRGIRQVEIGQAQTRIAGHIAGAAIAGAVRRCHSHAPGRSFHPGSWPPSPCRRASGSARHSSRADLGWRPAVIACRQNPAGRRRSGWRSGVGRRARTSGAGAGVWANARQRNRYRHASGKSDLAHESPRMNLAIIWQPEWRAAIGQARP